MLHQVSCVIVERLLEVIPASGLKFSSNRRPKSGLLCVHLSVGHRLFKILLLPHFAGISRDLPKNARSYSTTSAVVSTLRRPARLG